jgi:hypothetical protein
LYREKGINSEAGKSSSSILKVFYGNFSLVPDLQNGDKRHSNDSGSSLIGLLNKHGIENWLQGGN